jgi:hypothetical protein
MKEIQVQKERKLEEKLDKIADLLEELIKIHEEELYPSEDNIKINVLKKLEKKAKEISSGKRKTIKFKTIQELDQIIDAHAY